MTEDVTCQWGQQACASTDNVIMVRKSKNNLKLKLKRVCISCVKIYSTFAAPRLLLASAARTRSGRCGQIQPQLGGSPLRLLSHSVQVPSCLRLSVKDFDTPRSMIMIATRAMTGLEAHQVGTRRQELFEPMASGGTMHAIGEN